MASTSGLQLPSAVRARGAVWPRADPALGFASCRVVGHVAVHRPGSTPVPITSPRTLRGQLIRPRSVLSAHGFATFLPATQKSSELLAELIVIARCSASRGPSSLQRFDETDALPT